MARASAATGSTVAGRREADQPQSAVARFGEDQPLALDSGLSSSPLRIG